MKNQFIKYFMMRRHFLVGGMILIACMLLFASCEEIMNVSFTGDSSKNLVVEGTITTDTMSHKVILSYSGDFFNKAPQEMATGASVSISDPDTTFTLTEKAPGEYYTGSNVHGVAGRTYTLNIDLNDGRHFTASDELRPCADFDSISQSANHNSYINGYGYGVLFYGDEPQPAGDYYLYLLYVDNVLYSDTLSELSFASDEFVNGMYVRDYMVYNIRESDIKSPSSTVTLEMLSITKEYYRFLSSMLLETVWRGSPWDGPPANVRGNISNGAMGYFRASAVRRRSRTFISLPRSD